MPADAFFDPRWRIIYSVACDLRNRISDQIVCALSVTDAIAFQELDYEFQRAFDSTNTLDWHSWPTHTDTSLAGSIRTLEHCLAHLAKLYSRRQAAQIGAQLQQGNLELPAAITSLQEIVPRDNGSLVGRALASFIGQTPNPQDTILGNRFLCRQGTMLFVGPSGIGKTAASIQQDLLWSIGKPAFGIAPARPLKILTIQAEDDEGDMMEITSGIQNHLALSSEEIITCTHNCVYITEKSHTGDEFLRKVLLPLLEKYKPDLVRINPLQAYLGGDIKEAEVTAAFLRNGINPLLARFNCALIIVHHTPKTQFRNTEEWKASDWMYAGAGSADITNWARAILVVDPTDDPKVFSFIAAKRGSRIGWADDNGDSAFARHFSQATGSEIYWEETPPYAIPTKEDKDKIKFDPEKIDQILQLMSAIASMPTTEIQKQASSEYGIPKSTFYLYWEELKRREEIIQQHGKWLRT